MRALECGGEKHVQAIQDVVVEELFFNGQNSQNKSLKEGKLQQWS